MQEVAHANASSERFAGRCLCQTGYACGKGKPQLLFLQEKIETDDSCSRCFCCYGHSVYDLLYLVSAGRSDAVLLTSDRTPITLSSKLHVRTLPQ